MYAGRVQCEIFYVGKGWKWRIVSSAGVTRMSDRSYGLFYDCVVAARESGHTPAGVLPQDYRKASSNAG